MAPRIIECEQGSADWFRARMGMATASRFTTVVCESGNARSIEARAKYMRELAGEKVSEELTESYTNQFMERGKVLEAEAREAYSIITGNDVAQIGFIVNDGYRAGASPDGLIGKKKAVEIKTAKADILIAHLQEQAKDSKYFPHEHLAQTQGNLLVSERDEIDLMIYCKKLPAFITTARRDKKYIPKIEVALRQFNEELDALVEFVRKLG